MNAEMLRNMSIIAEDENLLKRAAKYDHGDGSGNLLINRTP